MNKKTFKKRAFISAIAMLVVSAIVLTSATFAWFAMSSQVSVDDMKLSITAPQGVQISANPFAFTTTLTTDYLKTEYNNQNNRFGAYIGNRNYIASVMEPVSTSFYRNDCVNPYNFGFPAFFKGGIDATGQYLSIDALSKNEEPEDTTYFGEMGSGYTVFDVFVKVSYQRELFFSDSTITCTSNGDVPSAMRMGFINCGPVTGDIKEDGTNAQLIRDVRPSTHIGNSFVLAFNADHHTADAKNLYGIAENTTYPTYTFHAAPATPRDLTTPGMDKYPSIRLSKYDDYTGYPYYEVNKLSNGALIAYNGQAKADAPQKVTSNVKDHFTVQSGINRIRVYIWMEGQDYDCATDVAGNDIIAKVVFGVDINETEQS